MVYKILLVDFLQVIILVDLQVLMAN